MPFQPVPLPPTAMQISSEQINKIEYVISHFSFEKIHLAMITLDWVWVSENGELKVPSVAELKAKATYLLMQTLKNNSEEQYTYSSGGITAKRFLKTDESPELFELSFVLTSCDSEFYQ